MVSEKWNISMMGWIGLDWIGVEELKIDGIGGFMQCLLIFAQC